MHAEYTKGLILTALGVLLLSFDALLIRLIDREAFDLLFWRGLLMSVAIILWCAYRKPGTALFSMDAGYMRSALLFTCSAICFVVAIMMTSVANVLIIISAQPLFAALMSRAFLGEKSGPFTWLSIVIAMGGIAWVLAGSWQSPNLTGDLVAMLCALCLSAKFVNDRALAPRDMSPALILSGFLIAGISFAFGAPFSLEGAQWGWMLLLCVLILPLAFVLITLGPMRIPAAEVGMLMLLETAAGPLWTWLWLEEVPSDAALQGGVVVVGILLLHGWVQWRRKQRVRVS